MAAISPNSLWSKADSPLDLRGITPVRSVAVLLSGGEQFSPYYGGALARWTFEVYRRLREDCRVQVFGFPTKSKDRYGILPHHPTRISHVCRAIARVPGFRRYEDSIWLNSLMRWLREYDILHIHNRPQWVALLRKLGYAGTVVLHLQNDHLGHWTAGMLEVLANDVDLVAVCSGYLKDTFALKSPAIAAKTRVIFNGVDTSLFFPRETERELKTIFFVGRFDQEKGVLELVRAYERLLRRHPDAILVIGGATGFGLHKETAYVRAVRCLSERIMARGGQIQFTGYLHHDNDLPRWFKRATVFVCPSLFQEPFGMVNVEAMACATPVIAASRGGIPEVLGGAGILIEPNDIDGFANVLSDLLDQPEARLRLGRGSYERCCTMFRWEVISRNWLSALNDLRPRNCQTH